MVSFSCKGNLWSAWRDGAIKWALTGRSMHRFLALAFSLSLCLPHFHFRNASVPTLYWTFIPVCTLWGPPFYGLGPSWTRLRRWWGKLPLVSSRSSFSIWLLATFCIYKEKLTSIFSLPFSPIVLLARFFYKTSSSSTCYTSLCCATLCALFWWWAAWPCLYYPPSPAFPRGHGLIQGGKTLRENL